MDNGGVCITMLGEKRAEYPSGIDKLRRLTGGRDMGAGLRGLGSGGNLGLGCAVNCVCARCEGCALIVNDGRGGMGGSTLKW